MVKIFELAFLLEVTPLSWPALRLVFCFPLTHTQHQEGREKLRGKVMEWKHLVANITGTGDQELLVRNEKLVTANRLLRHQITGRVRLSDGERMTLAEIGYRLGKQALQEGTTIVKPDTILAWHQKLVAQQCDGSQQRKGPGRPRVAPALEALVVRMTRTQDHHDVER